METEEVGFEPVIIAGESVFESESVTGSFYPFLY